VRNDILWINPKMPKQLKKLNLFIHFRGHSLNIEMIDDHFIIKIFRSLMPSGKIGFSGKIYDFKQGDVFNFSVNKESISSLEKIAV
jgi:trehalose/maltose hydrolase-like predicted phosphorylase